MSGCHLSYGITSHPTQVSTSRFNTSQATMEGWEAELTLGGWLDTEMVYSPTDGHPSKY